MKEYNLKLNKSCIFDFQMGGEIIFQMGEGMVGLIIES